MRRREGARSSMSIGSAENEHRYVHTNTGIAISTDHGDATRWNGCGALSADGTQLADLMEMTMTRPMMAITERSPTCRSELSVGRKVSGTTSATAEQLTTTASTDESARPATSEARGRSSWRRRSWLATSVRKVVRITDRIVAACAQRPAATRSTWSYERRPPCRLAALSRKWTDMPLITADSESRPMPLAKPQWSSAHGIDNEPPPTIVPTSATTACDTSPRLAFAWYPPTNTSACSEGERSSLPRQVVASITTLCTATRYVWPPHPAASRQQRLGCCARSELETGDPETDFMDVTNLACYHTT